MTHLIDKLNCVFSNYDNALSMSRGNTLPNSLWNTATA